MHLSGIAARGAPGARIDKRVDSLHAALAGTTDGATVLISGFGRPGCPMALIRALLDLGADNLTVVANNGGTGRSDGVASLLAAGRVRKLICSYPRSAGSVVLQELYASRKIELEIVAQGTLSERLRAGASGLGGFYTPTGAETQLAEGKEKRRFNGRTYVLEHPIVGDVALIKASRADRWGNLTYRGCGRNYGPVMAAAGGITVAEVDHISDTALDPESIVTPGIFVDRVVEV